jgi:hypothetical protein
MEKFRGMQRIPWPAAALLAAAYIFVVCVVDYKVLKKRNLLKLTWFTFTGYALTFSLVAFLLSVIIKGSALQQRTLTMVDVCAEDGIARGQTYVAFFSSAPRRYNFVCTNKSIFPSIMGDRYTGVAAEGAPGVDEYFTLNDDYMRLERLPIPVWTAKSFQVLWHDDWKSLFRFELKRQGKILTGTVTNQSRYDFKNCVLMTLNSRYHIPDLPSGRSVTISSEMARWYTNTWNNLDNTNLFQTALKIARKQGDENDIFARFMDFRVDNRSDYDFTFSRGFFVYPAKYNLKKYLLNEGRWTFLAFSKDNPLDIRASNAFASEDNYTLIRVLGPPASLARRGDYTNLKEFRKWRIEQEKRERR